MKIFISISFILNLNIAYGQFAIISDKDSFCNVRNSNNSIIDKLENSHFVYCFQNNSNWTDVSYSKKNIKINGKVYSNRLKYISSYEKIPIVEITSNKVKLKKTILKLF